MILEVYELVRQLRDASVSVISGFHSPMERECLDLLLRGDQPVIVCPARSIERMRIPPSWKAPIADGRLLIVSPFVERQPRITAQLAEKRNRFVAQLADEVFIAHAAPESKTLAFCEELLQRKKPVLTINRPENGILTQLNVPALEIRKSGWS